jgi:thymidine kinase
MFSGKTERLIAHLNRATYAKKRILILKPASDTRTTTVASREVLPDGATRITATMNAHLISSPEEFRKIVATHAFDVLAIDEAQFFPLDTPQTDTLGWLGREVRDLLRARNTTDLRIIVAGLDTDFAEEPFGPMPGLLALADAVEKLSAVCMSCGAEGAHHSERLADNRVQVAVGDAGMYKAHCRSCYSGPS